MVDDVAKKKVYVETSVISTLTARTSPRLEEAGKQIATIEWWRRAVTQYQLYISPVVEKEIVRGDAEAAQRRVASIKSLPSLPFDDRMSALAMQLLDGTAVPASSYDDALHIATATINKMDFIVTWNCRHIANGNTKPTIRRICASMGYDCPEICTPYEL